MKAVQATIYVTSDNKKYFTAFGAAYHEAQVQYDKSRNPGIPGEWGEGIKGDRAIRAIAKKILEDFKASRVSTVSNDEMAHRQEITPLPENHPSVVVTREQLDNVLGTFVNEPVPVTTFGRLKGLGPVQPGKTSLSNAQISDMVLLEDELISLSKHVDPSEVVKKALTGIKLKDVPEQLIRDTYWRLVDNGSIKV